MSLDIETKLFAGISGQCTPVGVVDPDAGDQSLGNESGVPSLARTLRRNHGQRGDAAVQL